MDIRGLLDQPTSQERAAVDQVVSGDPSGWEGGEFSVADGRVAMGGHQARARRHLLLPALHAVQDATGMISRGALGYVCDRLTIPPAEAYGVATFYSLFATSPRSRTMIHVCDDIVCARRGADDLKQALESELGPAGGANIETGWSTGPCLGQCDRAPAALAHSAGIGYSESAPVDPETVSDLSFEELPPTLVNQPRDHLSLLSRVGVVDPMSLDSYREADGYGALAAAIEMGQENLLEALDRSGLRGRGGAAFPIGAKWRGVAEAQDSPKYVIANGDESEPGTFKDRVLMESDPFALIEALTIGGFATGAAHGLIYVRGEYPTAERRLRHAVQHATAQGLLGDDVAGAGFSFSIEIRRGAGAYICGEETALFASIEGHRGEPRQKPPFPTERGVFGRPTAVNNVETLVAVLCVLEMGADVFASIGTERSKGPKLFCVSGDVERPGVYEIPFGTSLGDLLDLSGGVRNDSGIGAVLLGGAAGVFVGADALDLELSFEGAAERGATLGSGAVIVFDDQTDFAPVVQRIARFFRDESCGQCAPCRIGTVRQEEALARLVAGAPLGSVADERRRLDDLARVMTDASICGLGQTAASALQSAFKLGLPGVPS